LKKKRPSWHEAPKVVPKGIGRPLNASIGRVKFNSSCSVRYQSKTRDDHVAFNEVAAQSKHQLIDRIIDSKFGKISSMNLPKIEKESGFSRRDIINIYCHYLSIFRL